MVDTAPLRGVGFAKLAKWSTGHGDGAGERWGRAGEGWRSRKAQGGARGVMWLVAQPCHRHTHRAFQDVESRADESIVEDFLQPRGCCRQNILPRADGIHVRHLISPAARYRYSEP